MNKDRLYDLSKNKVDKADLTTNEITFMSHIFNTVLDSEDYISTVKYLAGINEMTVSDIKLLIGIYFLKIASPGEKKEYSILKENIRKQNNSKSRGFASISIISSIVILILTFGIYVAYIIYNLM